MGSLTLHTVQGHFPSGGWGWSWIGDPDAGTGQNQPGGWCYNIMPYLDQKNVHNIGMTGVPAATSWNLPQKFAGNQTRAQTPVRGFNCPTRRDSILFTRAYNYVNAPNVTAASRTDYAANTGSQGQDEFFNGPGDYPTGLSASWWASQGHSNHNGVIYERSMTTMADITAGPSNVYLIGEKYLNPNNYFNGSDPADNECMEVGQDNDICRDTASPPMQDVPGLTDTQRFGSAHRNGCNMSFCDGSVQFVAYTIAPSVHFQRGQRYWP
jgi:prepilin-type processing-associated H-X9-DG protein